MSTTVTSDVAWAVFLVCLAVFIGAGFAVAAHWARQGGVCADVLSRWLPTAMGGSAVLGAVAAILAAAIS